MNEEVTLSPVATLFVFLALLTATAAQADPSGADAAGLRELRKTFTVAGHLVPPEIFRDFGDGDLADSGTIWTSVDVGAATGSNLYADPVAVHDGWVVQNKPADKDGNSEQTGYRFIGAASNGLLVAIASYRGGGSGDFFTLHMLDAVVRAAFDDAGKVRKRLLVTMLRSIALGDRWAGDVKITGNAVTVSTTRAGPADDSNAVRSTVFEARRP